MPWGWVILGSVALAVAGEVAVRAWAFKRVLKLQQKAMEAVIKVPGSPPTWAWEKRLHFGPQSGDRP